MSSAFDSILAPLSAIVSLFESIRCGWFHPQSNIVHFILCILIAVDNSRNP